MRSEKGELVRKCAASKKLCRTHVNVPRRGLRVDNGRRAVATAAVALEFPKQLEVN